MLERFGRQYGREGLSLSADARAAIASHAWPGNVRELINVVQRAALLTRGPEASARDLGLVQIAPTVETRVAQTAATPEALRFDFASGRCTAEGVERELIVQALQHTGGNVSKAARLLRMQRSSLRYRIERFELDGLVRELASR